MSDTAEKTIVLTEFTVWDNDISPCPEYYDKENKTYYMNDYCSQDSGIRRLLYGKTVEIVKVVKNCMSIRFAPCYKKN